MDLFPFKQTSLEDQTHSTTQYFFYALLQFLDSKFLWIGRSMLQRPWFSRLQCEQETPSSSHYTLYQSICTFQLLMQFNFRFYSIIFLVVNSSFISSFQLHLCNLYIFQFTILHLFSHMKFIPIFFLFCFRSIFFNDE